MRAHFYPPHRRMVVGDRKENPVKPKVKKYRTKKFWVVWHGPLNMVGMPFHTWEEAMSWANQYSRQHAVEPTC